MSGLAAILGAIILVIILWDGFEVIVLPRRVARRVRLSRIFYLSTWAVWRWLAMRVHTNRRRERYLSFYGPLSLLFLVVVWAIGMIAAFAMVQWSVGPPGMGFLESLYLSGTTFITLGMGVPHTRLARAVLVLEAGVGFGFLAMVISYLPVLYQSFAKRETNILLLDARAGSPPTVAELFRRYAKGHGLAAIDPLLQEWEIWSADLLETYISYPVLAYFRSQHDNQSWLAALTTILDVCAVVIAGIDGLTPWQARLTFAMARHTVVDLAQIVNAPPRSPVADRLPPTALAEFKAGLAAAGVAPNNPAEFDAKLAELRRMYEPYVFALSQRFLLNPATWMRVSKTFDNWRTSAWEHSSSGLPQSLFDDGGDVHT
ncbi:MAG TPA: potassium channel family protein [Bryobacteraceae bacterium]|nr:potassium channel family protein [Bryobacteraceae bacterium]